jgi:hypothetical protein
MHPLRQSPGQVLLLVGPKLSPKCRHKILALSQGLEVPRVQDLAAPLPLPHDRLSSATPQKNECLQVPSPKNNSRATLPRERLQAVIGAPGDCAETGVEEAGKSQWVKSHARAYRWGPLKLREQWGHCMGKVQDLLPHTIATHGGYQNRHKAPGTQNPSADYSPSPPLQKAPLSGWYVLR